MAIGVAIISLWVAIGTPSAAAANLWMARVDMGSRNILVGGSIDSLQQPCHCFPGQVLVLTLTISGRPRLLTGCFSPVSHLLTLRSSVKLESKACGCRAYVPGCRRAISNHQNQQLVSECQQHLTHLEQVDAAHAFC